MLVVVADEAAVDDVGGAGDVGGFVGGEEGDEAGDLFGLAHAAERDVGEEGVELGLVVEQLGVDGGDDGAGGDVVDGDAERAEFDGEVAHEHAHAALGGAVGGEVGEDHVLVDGGDVDDAAGLFGVAEAADEGLGEEEGALEVDVEDGVVVGFGDVPEVGAASRCRRC